MENGLGRRPSGPGQLHVHVHATSPLIASGLATAGVILGAAVAQAQYPPAFLVDSATPIAMRDGVMLQADVWRPQGVARAPVLIYRTPYDRRRSADTKRFAEKAASRGYAVVLQDVRGRYGSDGTFDPYRQEGRDGYDTIEWAAAQPWSNGAVGTFGLSYPGAVQWLAALERPPHLRAMVPAMTYATPETFWYSGGVWDGSWLDWTWFNIAPDLRRRLGLPGPQTQREAMAVWSQEESRLRAAPLADLPDLKGVAPWYYEWMTHPPGDPWWSWATLEGRYPDVSAAVLNISGWFDEPYGPAGAADNYAGLRMAGTPTGLILGAWTHGGQQDSTAGDRDFGPASPVDYQSTILDWMDRYLRSPGTPLPDAAAVRAFVMGANRWREFPNWPPAPLQLDTLFLAPRVSGKAARLKHGKPADSQTWAFESDPAHPLRDPAGGAGGAHDGRELMGRNGLLVFESEPLPAAIEVIGTVQASVLASATVPDFDLWLQLYDVAPDGTAWNLSSPGTALVRASYRGGGPERSLVEPGQVVLLAFNRLLTANRFEAGHRVRVVISSAFAPLFSINPQTGEVEFTSGATRAGTIRLHAGSFVVLPVVAPRS